MNQEDLLKEIEHLRRQVTELEVTQLRLRETAQSLRESEEKFRAIFDGARDGIFVVDPRSRKAVVANSSMCRLTGYSLSELMQRSVDDIHPPDKLNYVLSQFHRLWEGKITVAQDVPVLRKDGTIVYCDISTGFSRVGSEELFLGFFRDISDRKQREDELVQERARFKSVAENAPFGMMMIGQDGEIHYVSRKFVEMFGYELRDVPNGREWFRRAFPDPDYRHEVISGWIDELDRFAPGEQRPRVLQVTCKDGSRKTIHFRTVQLSTGEHLVTCEDITSRQEAERSFLEHVSMLEGILQRAADGICVFHSIDEEPYVRFTHWNPRMEEITGYTIEEINSLGWYQGLHPHPTAHHRKADRMSRMRLDDDIRAEEWVITMKSGEQKPLSLSTSTIKEEDGHAYVLAIMQDISDRKKAEEALRESEEKFKDMFDNSADLVYTHDLDGNYTSVNRACDRLLGYTAEEFLKLNFRHIVDPDYLALTERNFRMKADGRAERTGPYEVLVHKKNGQTLWLEVNSRIILEHGERVEVHGTARDITDRKQAEEQLKRLFAAVEQADEAIVVTDATGTILYVNPAFEKITGYVRDEAVGNNPRILKSGRHDRAFYKQMWKTLAAGETWRGRLTNRRKDGSLYQETATLSPIKDEAGRIVNFVAVKRDVTGEMTLEKQLLQAQKMEAVGTLAGGIAHDFNNLLMIILGYADLLIQQKHPRDSDREKLAAIKQAAKDGSDLVNRILTFSRRVESKVRPIDLNEEIRRIEKLMLRTLPKMIEIDLVLEDNLRTINGDPAQIEQILLNLAVNAHHAMPEGGRLVIETSNVTLREDYCKIHAEAKPGKYVLLSVSDTGSGIEPEILDRVFEPFFTTKEDGQGTGLGLSMVHGIVAQHGGSIRCYSEPGVGTTFKIYFHAVISEVMGEPAMTVEMPAFGTEKILLVDDDKQIRALAAEMLMLAGYDVITASNGQEALEIYQKLGRKIELIILDLIMPGMSGNQCLKELLRIDPEVKVLISSGYSANGPTKKVTGTGARGFVTKPYDTKEILGAIRRILDEG